MTSAQPSKDKKSDQKGKKLAAGQGAPKAVPPIPMPLPPGTGINPHSAMQGQASQGPPAAMPPMPVAMPDVPIPGGFGGMPMDNGIDDAMLMAMLSGQGETQDPYATFPGESQQGFQGMGVAPPQMGLEEMIKLLMLAQAGVNPGSPVNSSSGMVSDQPSNAMAGMDFMGGQGFGM